MAVASVLITLSACGSGGGGGNSSEAPSQAAAPATLLNARFVDAPTSHLGYRCDTGALQFTADDGSFSCPHNSTVYFLIGDITLGSFTLNGDDIDVTPMDLVSGADNNDDTVLHRVQLLLTLDDDQNPDNGLHISDATHRQFIGVSIDFNQTDFSTRYQTLIENRSGHALASHDTAQQHLQRSLQALRAGLYQMQDDDGYRASLLLDRQHTGLLVSNAGHAYLLQAGDIDDDGSLLIHTGDGDLALHIQKGLISGWHISEGKHLAMEGQRRQGFDTVLVTASLQPAAAGNISQHRYYTATVENDAQHAAGQLTFWFDNGKISGHTVMNVNCCHSLVGTISNADDNHLGFLALSTDGLLFSGRITLENGLPVAVSGEWQNSGVSAQTGSGQTASGQMVDGAVHEG